MRQIVAVFLAAILILSADPAAAHKRPPLSASVDVEVVGDSGGSLHHIPFRSAQQGQLLVNKRYLVARQGENYGIKVRNRSAERIGVVIAVDGRNIITGERSELGHREAMYIVAPGETARYDGWRTSSSEVHRFYFTASDDSYAIRTFDDSSAMGLIAVAVFRERPKPPALSLKRESTAPSAGRPQSSSDAAEKQAGTGFGDSAYSPVMTVAFDPERRPVQKELIKYEWREVLCRKGILDCGQEGPTRLWDDAHYAPHPPENR